MTPHRKKLLLAAAKNRQLDLAVVLENVHDPHNISAVLRTCDSVGVGELYLLLTDPGLQKKKIQMGKRSSAGARKWMQVFRFHDAEKCFAEIQKKYKNVIGTYLDKEKPGDLFELDLTNSLAFVFGNEHAGLSSEVKKMCDRHFMIPQSGLVQSLNISVACAVTLYETYRQRKSANLYDRPEDHFMTQKAMHFFLNRIKSGDNGRNVIDNTV